MANRDNYSVRVENVFDNLTGAGLQSRPVSKSQKKRQKRASKKAALENVTQPTEDEIVDQPEAEQVDESPAGHSEESEQKEELPEGTDAESDPVVQAITEMNSSYAPSLILKCKRKLEEQGKSADAIAVLKELQGMEREELLRSYNYHQPAEIVSPSRSDGGASRGARAVRARGRGGSVRGGRGGPVVGHSNEVISQAKAELPPPKTEEAPVDVSTSAGLQRAASQWDPTTKQGVDLLQDWAKRLKSDAAFLQLFTSSHALELLLTKLLTVGFPKGGSRTLQDAMLSILSSCVTNYGPGSDYSRWLNDRLLSLSISLEGTGDHKKRVFVDKIVKAVSIQKRAHAANAVVAKMLHQNSAAQEVAGGAHEDKYVVDIKDFFKGEEVGRVVNVWERAAFSGKRLGQAEKRVSQYRSSIGSSNDEPYRSFTSLDQEVTMLTTATQNSIAESQQQKQNIIAERKKNEEILKNEKNRISQEEMQNHAQRRDLQQRKFKLEQELQQVNRQLELLEAQRSSVSQNSSQLELTYTNKLRTLETQETELAFQQAALERERVCTQALQSLVTDSFERSLTHSRANINKLASTATTALADYFNKVYEHIMNNNDLADLLHQRIRTLKQKLQGVDDSEMVGLGLKSVLKGPMEAMKLQINQTISQDDKALARINDQIRQIVDGIVQMARDDTKSPPKTHTSVAYAIRPGAFLEGAQGLLKRLEDKPLRFDLTKLRSIANLRSPQQLDAAHQPQQSQLRSAQPLYQPQLNGASTVSAVSAGPAGASGAAGASAAPPTGDAFVAGQSRERLSFEEKKARRDAAAGSASSASSARGGHGHGQVYRPKSASASASAPASVPQPEAPKPVVESLLPQSSQPSQSSQNSAQSVPLPQGVQSLPQRTSRRGKPESGKQEPSRLVPTPEKKALDASAPAPAPSASAEPPASADASVAAANAPADPERKLPVPEASSSGSEAPDQKRSWSSLFANSKPAPGTPRPPTVAPIAGASLSASKASHPRGGSRRQAGQRGRPSTQRSARH